MHFPECQIISSIMMISHTFDIITINVNFEAIISRHKVHYIFKSLKNFNSILSSVPGTNIANCNYSAFNVLTTACKFKTFIFEFNSITFIYFIINFLISWIFNSLIFNEVFFSIIIGISFRIKNNFFKIFIHVIFPFI